MTNLNRLLAPLLAATLAALVVAVPAAEAGTRQTSTVRIVNSTAYRVHYTVVDAYGAESAWIRPQESADWTAAHDGTIRTYGRAYDGNNEVVLEWEDSTWNVKDTPKFRLTITP